MKNKIIIIIGITILVICFFVFLNSGEKVTGYATINSISDVKKEKVSLTLGREGCTWCAKMKPVLNKVAIEKNVKIYYMDETKIDKKHNFEIPKKCADNVGQKLLDGFGTPLNLIIEDNQVIDCLNGYVDETVFKAYLRKNDIIK